MAFNFLGTIESIEQFEEFEEFINLEFENINQRIAHLNAELDKVNRTMDKYKASDLIMRSGYLKTNQADSFWRKNPSPSEPVKRKEMDALTAADVSDLKKMFLDSIKYKRERNEFKIKRLRDLGEQYKDEIKFLTDKQIVFLETIQKIKNRFDLPDFPEVQRDKPVSKADTTPGVNAIDINNGKIVTKGVTYYIVLSLDPNARSVTIENEAPALKPGDTVVFSNGLNNGEKTVDAILDGRTFTVLESLVDEETITSRITKKG